MLLDPLWEYYEEKEQNYKNGSISTSLSAMDHCMYRSFFNALSEEQREEASRYIYGGFYMSLYRFLPNAAPKYEVKKNETLETLLARFLDKKSRRVVESRKEIKRRFEYQSYGDQKKIIKAFLSSPNEDDREWAACQADKLWDDSFIEPLRYAFGLRRSSYYVIITAIRHMPIDFVKEIANEDIYPGQIELYIRLGNEPDFSIEKYKLNIFDYLYVMARLGREISENEEEIEKSLFLYLYKWLLREMIVTDFLLECKFEDFPNLRRTIWALGQLKMPNLIFKIFECQAYINANQKENTAHESLKLAKEWIDEKWDYEGRDELLGSLVLINGYDLVDYRGAQKYLPDLEIYMNSFK